MQHHATVWSAQHFNIDDGYATWAINSVYHGPTDGGRKRLLLLYGAAKSKKTVCALDRDLPKREVLRWIRANQKPSLTLFQLCLASDVLKRVRRLEGGVWCQNLNAYFLPQSPFLFIYVRRWRRSRTKISMRSARRHGLFGR